jgi:predicted P-loop ATPase
VATTNEETYLRDATGNRRFWPVKVGKIDLAAVAADRDQLWAEAAAIEATGEALTIPEGLWSEAAVEQKSRREPDAWEDPISERLGEFAKKEVGAGLRGFWSVAINDGGHRELRVSTSYILEHILGIPIDRQSDGVCKRLANVMRDMGWTRHDKVVRISGVSCRGYTKMIEKMIEKAAVISPPVPKMAALPRPSVFRVRRIDQ